MYRINKLTALLFTLIVVALAFIVFVLNLSKVSLPKDLETYDNKEINDTLKIYRNQYGIPHIVAKNESDAFFTLGFAHAQDRLWQMEFLRRAAEGRLSEIIGKETVNVDMFMRSLGITRTSYQVLKAMPKGSRALLESYAKGVNFYMETHKNRMPFEFNALSYFPAKWEAVNSIEIGRLMAFQLSVGFWNDIALGEIADKAGISKAMELMPSYPSSAPHVLDDTASVSSMLRKDSLKLTSANAAELRKSYKIMGEFAEALKPVREALGIKGSSFGSNSWAVKTFTNRKKSAILANDPHLFLELPPIWYQAHLTCPTINAIGLTIPGVPFMLSGRNDNISWGITNIMIDDCDFFIEKTDSANANYYLTPAGTKAKFVFRTDTIKVKNSTNVLYYTRYTNHSAVISDFHLFNHPEDVIDMNTGSDFKNKYLKTYCITYSWLGNKVSDEVTAAYRVIKSRNWQQFVAAVHLWGIPGQNFTYADESGNIGICPAGSVPIRETNCNPNLPNPGWLNGYSWSGVRDAADFPNVYNPRAGFVASANNKTSHNLGFYVSDYWEPSSRIERIEELLKMSTDYTARDAQLMQMDFLSPYARKLMGIVLPVLNSKRGYMSDIEKKSLDIMNNWDFVMNPREASPAIYNSFFERLLYNTFEDELGERLYKEYVLVSNVPTRRILEMMQDSSSAWFDDVTTANKVETKENIIFKSFRDANSYLVNRFRQTDPYKWQYGKMHTLTLEHVFSRNKFLKPSVTLGPFEMGGNLTTVNNTEYRIYKPFDVVLGASMRFVTDMQDTLVYTSVPGGSSGDAMSVNYGDQVQLWLNGGYVRLSTNRAPTSDFRLSLVVEPDRK